MSIPGRDGLSSWDDAGDHGKYVVKGGISVWTLMDFADEFYWAAAQLFLATVC